MPIHSNASVDGPQVFSRPGSKRHLKQLRARAVYTAVKLSGLQASECRAIAAHDAAVTAHAAAKADLDSFIMAALIVLPAVGSA